MINIISGNSYHALNHWQSGTDGGGPYRYVDADNFVLFGATHDHEVYLFPYFWYEEGQNTITYEETNGYGYYAFDVTNLPKLYKGCIWYDKDDEENSLYEAFGIYGPVRTKTVPKARPWETVQAYSSVSLKWAQLKYENSKLWFDNTKAFNPRDIKNFPNEIELTKDYTGGVINVTSDIYVMVYWHWNGKKYMPDLVKEFDYTGTTMPTRYHYLMEDMGVDNDFYLGQPRLKDLTPIAVYQGDDVPDEGPNKSITPITAGGGSADENALLSTGMYKAPKVDGERFPVVLFRNGTLTLNGNNSIYALENGGNQWTGLGILLSAFCYDGWPFNDNVGNYVGKNLTSFSDATAPLQVSAGLFRKPILLEPGKPDFKFFS